MKNKVLVKLIVPKINKTYNVYLHINKTVGNCIILLNKAVLDLNEDMYISSNTAELYNKKTGQKYESRLKIYQTDIRNFTELVLI